MTTTLNHGTSICMECETVIYQCKCPGHNMTIHTLCQGCVTQKEAEVSRHADLSEGLSKDNSHELTPIELIETIKTLSAALESHAREVDRYRSLFFTYYSHYRIARDALIIYADSPKIGDQARAALKVIRSLDGDNS